MRFFRLVIAGYRIGFRASDDGPGLTFSSRFLNFADEEPDCDLVIYVHRGPQLVPDTAALVFQAPEAEEFSGQVLLKTLEFWSIWKNANSLYLTTSFPLSQGSRKGLLKFSIAETEWHLWTDERDELADPFEYPLDGLILYYLSVMNMDIFIHASGVKTGNHGFLFSGVSGKGKSTIAGIWKNNGAEVIHDDRIIIRKGPGGYYMHNTPVYPGEVTASAQLEKLFIIEHGTENMILPLKGSAAVSQLISNCIQHAWSEKLISGLVESVSTLCDVIPVSKLIFRPDNSIVDLILQKSGQ
jgi:hypothetical protein